MKLKDYNATPNRTIGKNVVTSDTWERYKVRFTVFDPLYQPGDTMTLEPVEHHTHYIEPIRMQRVSTRGDSWLTGKYGQQLPIWEGETWMDQH